MHNKSKNNINKFNNKQPINTNKLKQQSYKEPKNKQPSINNLNKPNQYYYQSQKYKQQPAQPIYPSITKIAKKHNNHHEILQSNQSSIIYEHINNISISNNSGDDGERRSYYGQEDRPPLLLDLSMERSVGDREEHYNNRGKGISREEDGVLGNISNSSTNSIKNNGTKIYNKSEYDDYNKYNNSSKYDNTRYNNHIKSIYIQEQPTNNNNANSLQHKYHNSTQDTQMPQYFTNQPSLQQQHQQQNSRDNSSRYKYEQSMVRTTFQIYNTFVNNKSNRQFLQQTRNKIFKKKQAKSMLAALIIDPVKIQKYVQELLEKQIQIKNQIYAIQIQQHQHIEQKEQYQQLFSTGKNKNRNNNSNHSYNQNHSFNSSTSIVDSKKKNIEILGILGCLMAKIKEGSARSGRQIPQVITDKNGQVKFNFGGAKTNSSIQNLHKYKLKSKNQNINQSQSLLINYSQKIQSLNKKLAQQDTSLQQIKLLYDDAINNYAKTFINLSKQNTKLKLAHKNNLTSQDKLRIPNIQQSKTKKNQKINQNLIDFQALSVKSREFNKSQNQNRDQQLQRLLLNGSRMDTLDIFNRLSTQSRRRSKSKHIQFLNQQLSFQRQE